MPCARTIYHTRTSYFHPVRLGLKATLVANLLVLGHVLLTTSGHASAPIHLIPQLPNSLSTISALIFLTLLWITFTLIECCDLSLKDPKEAEKGMVFSRTWIEGLSGIAVLSFWMGYWKDAEVVFEAFSQHLAGEFVLIPLTYFSAIISLIMLNFHLLISICLYTARNGPKSLNGEFWSGKTGWWVGRVELDVVVDHMENGLMEKV
ncbi:uncharacterized protein IL334_000628 [Kwoniella shivajii]|uniref:Uncharacterized protein n=1 Tax=Kwoniella shivajii TaxID=564305 RepID=A0ABZ1CQ06_9TREE|nr:hypothetical protein IL334_000628 [Kwoniella shivajii]